MNTNLKVLIEKCLAIPTKKKKVQFIKDEI